MIDWLRKILADPGNFLQPTPPGYHVYSTDFDEEIAASALLSHAGKTRDGQPTREIAWEAKQAYQKALHRVLTALTAQTMLAAERIVATVPTEARQSTAATLLIDHSGSMRDQNIQFAAAIADCFAILVGECSIPFEVLGFTTVNWKGGRAREAWLNDTRQWNPGRLCDLRHIVYSDFAAGGAPDLTAMFLPDVLKENVDGEALQWAAARLRAHVTERRLLIVVSDGAPVDDSTLSVHPSSFLWEHLNTVLRTFAAETDIELAGIGLHHRVSSLYSNSCSISAFTEIEEVVLPLFSNLFLGAAAGENS